VEVHGEQSRNSLSPSVSVVKYLNAVPLTRGLEGDIFLATPAKLCFMLRMTI